MAEAGVLTHRQGGPIPLDRITVAAIRAIVREELEATRRESHVRDRVEANLRRAELPDLIVMMRGYLEQHDVVIAKLREEAGMGPSLHRWLRYRRDLQSKFDVLVDELAALN